MMSGFFGCFSPNVPLDGQYCQGFERMHQILNHTSNRTQTIFKDRYLNLGICYLNTGPKQFIYEDELIIFVIEGVVHEVDDTWYQDIYKRVVQLFSESGNNFIYRIKGDFNILVYEKAKSRLSVFSDRFGFRYLYYGSTETALIFSPEVKGVVGSGLVSQSERESARTEFLYYGFLMNNDTIYKNVSLFPNASILVSDTAGLSVNSYWTPDYSESNTGKNAVEYAEEVYPLLEKSLLNRIRSRERIGVPLTGGKDSRLLLSIVKKHTDNIYAYTFGRRGCWDHKIAKKVAGIIGVRDYTFMELSSSIVLPNIEEAIWLDEGSIPATIMLVECGKRLHNKIDISLNGSFSGAYSMDCAHFTEDEVIQHFTEEEKIENVARRCGGGYFKKWKNIVLNSEVVEEFDKYQYLNIQKGLAEKEKITDKFYRQKDLFLLDNIKRRLQISLCSWKYYIDDQYPFADYDMFDFNLRLPYKFKMKKRVFFEIMKQQIPDLSTIKLQRQAVNVYQQRKFYQDSWEKFKFKGIYYVGRLSRGKILLYDPQWDNHPNQWFISNRDIQEYFRDILLDARTKKRGYFNIKNIENLIDESQRGSYNWNLLLKLVSFELWQRKFIDSKVIV